MLFTTKKATCLFQKFLVLLLLLAFTPILVFADDVNPLQSEITITPPVAFLKLDNEKPEVEVKNGLKTVIHLSGKYTREDYSFLIEETHANKKSESFSLELPIAGEEQSFLIHEVGPKGDVIRSEIKVRVPRFLAIQENIQEQNQKRLSTNVAIGPTFLNYAQTGALDYNEWLLTVRAGANYRFTNNWELSGNAFINALSIYSNHKDSVRFFGTNLRAGYVLQKPFSPWKITLNGGWYYLTSFGGVVGVHHLNGPQIYPSVNYQINKEQSAFGYFKYSPVANKIAFLSLSNREIAVGVGYGFWWLKKNFTVSVDVATLSLAYQGLKASSSSVTGLLGLRF